MLHPLSVYKTAAFIKIFRFPFILTYSLNADARKIAQLCIILLQNFRTASDLLVFITAMRCY